MGSRKRRRLAYRCVPTCHRWTTVVPEDVVATLARMTIGGTGVMLLASMVALAFFAVVARVPDAPSRLGAALVALAGCAWTRRVHRHPHPAAGPVGHRRRAGRLAPGRRARSTTADPRLTASGSCRAASGCSTPRSSCRPARSGCSASPAGGSAWLLAPAGLVALGIYSVGIELLQLELARIDRACDVTDVVDNVTGAAVGRRARPRARARCFGRGGTAGAAATRR